MLKTSDITIEDLNEGLKNLLEAHKNVPEEGACSECVALGTALVKSKLLDYITDLDGSANVYMIAYGSRKGLTMSVMIAFKMGIQIGINAAAVRAASLEAPPNDIH